MRSTQIQSNAITHCSFVVAIVFDAAAASNVEYLNACPCGPFTINVYHRCSAAWCLSASEVVDDVGVRESIFSNTNEMENVPEDAIGIIASFGRLSTWIRVRHFDLLFAAACKVQRAWRVYQHTARFVLGATVQLRAMNDNRPTALTIVQFVARRRNGIKENETWTGRLVSSRFRHYIYVQRRNDPTYVVTKKKS